MSPPSKKRSSQRQADLTAEEARASALRILVRREHSAAQLRQKLAARGYSPDICDEVIAELSELNLQSERRFAEILVRSRVGQGYGPQRIRAELKEARIDDALALEALETEDCDFAALAEQARAKKFGDLPEGAAQWQKQYRFLASRGFDSDDIRRVLKGADPFD